MSRVRHTIITAALLFVFTACDKLPTVEDVRVSDDAPSSCGEGGEHPFLSCDGPGPYDPVCEIGCSDGGDEGVEYMVCGIPCDSNADCEIAAGDSLAVCKSRCYYFCDDDHPCPDDLECVDRGNLHPDDPYPSGECKAVAMY